MIWLIFSIKYIKVNLNRPENAAEDEYEDQEERIGKNLVQELMELLYDPDGWDLKPPKMILSVTGGAKSFTLPFSTRKAFKRGLAKAAMLTRSWIITGGTEQGVMRLVGEAVAEEQLMRGKDLVVLGVATWGVIAERELLQNQDLHSLTNDNDQQLLNRPIKYSKSDDGNNQNDSKNVYLSSNHNHFVLVDDGTKNRFRREIQFRTLLEAELKKGLPANNYLSNQNQNQSNQKETYTEIPMILIVVQGSI